MATKSNTTKENRKINFGKRKLGNAQKSRNKHNRKSRVYRGQGRG